MRQRQAREEPRPEEYQTARSPLSHCSVKFPQEGAGRADCERKTILQIGRDKGEARLKALSTAFGRHVAREKKLGSTFAINRDGKGGPWCEAILNDVLSMKNVEAVDDFRARATPWTGDPGAPLYPVLDDGFEMWTFKSEQYPSGYVSFRWRDANYVLHIRATCFIHTDGSTRCAAKPYNGAAVYSGESPIPCSMMTVEAPYWDSWKDKVVPVRLAVPRGQDR